jgi:hypothetical protein
MTHSDTNEITSYGSDFYTAYAEQIKEPRVRKVHDRLFEMTNHVGPTLADRSAFDRVLDLGCGQSNEFYTYGGGGGSCYVGVDLHPLPLTKLGGRLSTALTVQGDFNDVDLSVHLVEEHKLTAIVSLYGIENNGPCEQNYALYRSLFQRTPIRSILTVGFYYGRAPHDEIFVEDIGFEVYQSVQPLEKTKSLSDGLFDEIRIEASCPSNLFGEDVIEVWKLLTRT